MSLIEEAISKGARKRRACDVVGISIRTLQRWVDCDSGAILEDRRCEADRAAPSNKLSDEERQAILDICHSSEFSHCSPNQIVPELADRGIYIASESTFYRVLKEHDQLAHRSRAKAKGTYPRPRSHKAFGPNQVWSWDISYLPSTIVGIHFYLYMIIDVFSRKIVGAEVFEQELGDHAAALLQRTVWRDAYFHASRSPNNNDGDHSITMIAISQ